MTDPLKEAQDKIAELTRQLSAGKTSYRIEYIRPGKKHWNTLSPWEEEEDARKLGARLLKTNEARRCRLIEVTTHERVLSDVGESD